MEVIPKWTFKPATNIAALHSTSRQPHSQEWLCHFGLFAKCGFEESACKGRRVETPTLTPKAYGESKLREECVENFHGFVVIVFQEPAMRIEGENEEVFIRRSERVEEQLRARRTDQHVESTVNHQSGSLNCRPGGVRAGAHKKTRQTGTNLYLLQHCFHAIGFSKRKEGIFRIERHGRLARDGIDGKKDGVNLGLVWLEAGRP